MSIITTICPEPKCKIATTAWASDRLISKAEWDYERACPKHKRKYRLLFKKWERYMRKP